MAKHYVVCENMCLEEAYSKKEVDELVNKKVKVEIQRYYDIGTTNPSIQYYLDVLPNDWYDEYGNLNYVLVGGYVGQYTNNGDVRDDYHPIEQHLSISYKNETYGISGSIQGFTVSSGYTLDVMLVFEKIN